MPIPARARTTLRAVAWVVVLGTGSAILLGRAMTPLAMHEWWLPSRLGAAGFAASVLSLQLGLALVAICVAAATCRSRSLAIVALAAALPGIGPPLWRLVPAGPEPAAPGAPVLRVMSINCLFENPTPCRLVDAVIQADPDILILAEYVPRVDEVIRPALIEGWPHRHVVLRAANRGQAIFSKLPLREPHEVPLAAGTWGAPALVADVDWHGRAIRIVGVHLPSPVTLDLLRQSCEEVRALVGIVSAHTGDLILAGDFNAPPTTWQYRTLVGAGLRESFASAGSGSGVTRPPEPLPPGELGGIRIDHVFARASLRFVSAAVGRDVGSDHLPVIAELAR